MNQIAKIQTYGERCSGTSYLESLIRKNLRDIPIEWRFGFKHFIYKNGFEKANDFLFIIIYRNAFDWLRSLHRFPYHAAHELRNCSFSEFIRKTWWCLWDEHAHKSPDDPLYGKEMMFERDPQTGERFTNVLRMRTAKILHWESLRKKTQNHVYVKYEDLRDNPKVFIKHISERFGIRKSLFFKNEYGYKGEKEKFIKKQFEAIEDVDYEYIISELDTELEKRIGYSMDKPETVG